LLWLLVAAWGAVALPLGLPILPPGQMSRYADWLGMGTTTNAGEGVALPEDYADMLRWDDAAAAVAGAWAALSPEERERTASLATNYGRAGAIDWFGSEELPEAIAPIGSYWFWGAGELPGEITIVLGEEASELEGRYFRIAREFTRVPRTWGVPEERDVPVTIARDPLVPLHAVWPQFEGIN